MRTVVACLTLALACAACLPVHAQNAFEASFGLGVPTGDLNEAWNGSVTLNGGYYIETSPFTMLGATLGYSRFGLDKDGFPMNYAVSGGDLSIIQLCAGARVKTGSMQMAHFYAGVGAGLYSVAISDLKVGSPGDIYLFSFDRENKVGGFLEGGMGYPVATQMKAGIKGQFHFFSTSQEHGFEDLSDTRSYFNLQLFMMFFM